MVWYTRTKIKLYKLQLFYTAYLYSVPRKVEFWIFFFILYKINYGTTLSVSNNQVRNLIKHNRQNNKILC